MHQSHFNIHKIQIKPIFCYINKYHRFALRCEPLTVLSLCVWLRAEKGEESQQ